jgi:hypothetical protein
VAYQDHCLRRVCGQRRTHAAIRTGSTSRAVVNGDIAISTTVLRPTKYWLQGPRQRNVIGCNRWAAWRWRAV